MKTVLAWLAVFAAAALADVCWAKYMQYANAKKRLPASIWGSAIIVCGCFSVVEYTSNHWLVTAAVAGAFCGTWFGVGRAE